MAELDAIITGGIFAFLMVFVRIGSAMMMMPGFGDNFIPAQIRLLFALALSLVLTPILREYVPAQPPTAVAMVVLLVMEATIGIFIGMIARVIVMALATAGMVISMQSALASAQVFNPTLGGQGSLVGSLLSLLGVVLIFATDLHHMLIVAARDSYALFPVGGMLDTGSMADLMAQMVSGSFLLGVQIAAPFMVVALIMYLGFGVLARLMPQIQIFFLALPVQILVSLVTLLLVVSAGMLFFLKRFEEGMMPFLGGG